tara:strand:+ start:446 stop:1207 length:762 start_codon:yes stop_codon:yes gene_type:complete
MSTWFEKITGAFKPASTGSSYMSSNYEKEAGINPDTGGILSGLLYTKNPKTGASEFDFNKVAGLAGLAGSAFGLFPSSQPVTGYQGEIPRYRAVRSRVPGTFDPTRRPGSGGQRYFSDMQFVPEADKEAAMAAAATEAKGLQSVNLANPAQDRTANMFMAEGGIATAKKKPRYLDGDTDGMADEVPAMIDNEQPAMLSDGEFVIPADVVSHLGNGNSDAGAKVLEEMMDEVRMARTGTKKQAPEIDPEDFLPT